MNLTVTGLLVLIAAALVLEFIAIRRDNSTTISETMWKLLLHPRAAFWLGIVLGTLLGHLFWPGQRTLDALVCESQGGVMGCIAGGAK